MGQSISSQNRYYLITFIVILLVTLTGCTRPAQPTGDGDEPPAGDDTPSASLAGTEWVLEQFGPADDPVTPAGTITADFTADEIGGSAGCNSYGGPYEVDGDSLMIRELAATEMACGNGRIMEQERTYLQALTAAHTFTRENGTLTISYEEGTLRFTRAEPVEDRSLEGTRWQLTGFGEGEVVSSLLSGTEITATFEAGTLTGTTGCNQYSARYRHEEERVTIEEIERTEEACDDGVMEQEDRFLSIIEGTHTYQIDGDQLILAPGAGTLYFAAAEPATSSAATTS